MGYKRVVNSQRNQLFFDANGKIHVPFRFEWNELVKDSARSSSSKEHCNPFALGAHCGTF